MQRRATAIPDHGPEQLSERAGADQPGDGLVLDERLLVHVADESEYEQPEGERRGHEDERLIEAAALACDDPRRAHLHPR